MSLPTHQTRSPITPLTDAERDQLLASLAELRRAGRRLLGSLPPHAQNASGLSRALGVERTTCQRFVAGISSAEVTPSMVSKLPSPQGLNLLVDAIQTHAPTGDAEALRSTRDAIDAYESMIRVHAGSQAKLIRRIRSDERQPPHMASGQTNAPSARAMLFDSAAEIVGRSSDVWVSSHVFTPHESKPGLIREARAHGNIGHRAGDEAVPMTLHVFGDQIDQAPDVDAPRHYRPIRPQRRDALLTEFSSDPAPVVHSTGPGVAIAQMIDQERASSEEGIDVIFGLEGVVTHPSAREDQVEELWGLINFPARRMIFDVFLHRDLARHCIPGLDHHLWRPDFAIQTGERWQTKFPRSPRLEVLSAGLADAQTKAWPRYTELLAFLLDTHSGSPGDYIGYRCECAYPVWRTGYRITLDFGDGATSA